MHTIHDVVTRGVDLCACMHSRIELLQVPIWIETLNSNMASGNSQATIFVLDYSASMNTPIVSAVETKAVSKLVGLAGKRAALMGKAFGTAAGKTLWEGLVDAVKVSMSTPVVQDADFIGGLAFAHDTQCLLTIQDKTKESIDLLISRLDAIDTFGSRTALYTALTAVIQQSETYDFALNIVVVTDGLDNASTEEDKAQCSELCEQLSHDGRLNIAVLAILPEVHHEKMRDEIKTNLGVDVDIVNRDSLSLAKLLRALQKTFAKVAASLR